MSYAQKAAESIENHLLDEAEQNIQLSMQSDLPDEIRELADFLFSKGFIQQSKELYAYLASLPEMEEESILRLAEICMEEGEDEQALEFLFAIQETSPFFVQSLMIQADLYQSQGLFEVSEQKLEQARLMEPDEPILLFALAELHFEMGSYPEALREYKELIEAGADEYAHISLSLRLAETNSLLGNWEEAVPLFKDALLEKEHPQTFFQLAFTYFQLEDYESAIHYLHAAKEMDPYYTTLYPLLVEAYSKNKQIDQAKLIFEEGMTVDQMNPDFLLLGARLFTGETERSKAINLLTQALALREDESIRIELSEKLEQESDPEKALEILGHQEEESDPVIFWKKALMNEELEHYNEAGKAYEKAAPYLMSHADFVKDYLFFLRDEGKWSEARTYLEKVKEETEMPEDTLVFLESYIRKD